MSIDVQTLNVRVTYKCRCGRIIYVTYPTRAHADAQVQSQNPGCVIDGDTFTCAACAAKPKLPEWPTTCCECGQGLCPSTVGMYADCSDCRTAGKLSERLANRGRFELRWCSAHGWLNTMEEFEEKCGCPTFVWISDLVSRLAATRAQPAQPKPIVVDKCVECERRIPAESRDDASCGSPACRFALIIRLAKIAEGSTTHQRWWWPISHLWSDYPSNCGGSIRVTAIIAKEGEATA